MRLGTGEGRRRERQGAELLAYLEMPGPAAPKWKMSPGTCCLRGPESSSTVGPLQAPKGSLSLSPAPGVAVPKAWRTAFHFSTDLSLLPLRAFAGLPAQRQGTCTQLSFAARGRAGTGNLRSRSASS